MRLGKVVFDVGYVVDLDKKIIKELVTAQEWAFEGELIFVEEVC